MSEAKKGTESLTGVSNVAYDLMIVLANKLEGIGAMEEYKRDAEEAGDSDCGALFDRLQQRDKQEVQELRQRLLRHLQEG